MSTLINLLLSTLLMVWPIPDKKKEPKNQAEIHQISAPVKSQILFVKNVPVPSII